MRMAQNHRTPGADVVNERIAIGVVELRSLSPGHKEWIPPHRPERADRRVHTARDDPAGAFKQLVGTRGLHYLPPFLCSTRAASFAKYVRIRSAPARLMLVSISII